MRGTSTTWPVVATCSAAAPLSPASARCDGRTLRRTFPKRSTSSTSPTTLPRSTSGSAITTSTRAATSTGAPKLGQVTAGGKVPGRGREDVPSLEHVGDRLQDDVRCVDGDRSPQAAVGSPGDRQQAVVRTDQETPGGGLDGDREASRSHARIDDAKADRVGRREAQASRPG